MSTEWFYQRLNYNGFVVKQKDPEGLRPEPICVVYEKKDAQLIVAAPEMLAALEAFVRWYDFEYGHPDNLDDWQDAMSEQMPRLRDVVAKAKGGQP
jgi:hypothetical protein